MRGLLLISSLILTSAPVVADTGSLRAIVSSSNAPPYALFDESGDLAGGISKDILEALASRSTLTLNFLPLPRGRVEQWLLRDEADIACFLSPAWVEQPELLAWSPSLFTTRQVIVRRSHSPSITQLTDLLGKRVGTDRGFSYPEFDAVFSQRLIIRDDAISLQSNLMRLQKQRLDAVLTVDRAYEYHQQQFNSEGLLADPLWTAPDNVYCAINPNRPELASRVQQTLQLMIDDGTIQRILLRYQPAVRNE